MPIIVTVKVRDRLLHFNILITNKMGAKIYNSDLSKELVDGAKIQIAVDGIPSEIAEKVVPVMEVNPKMFRRTNICVGTSKVVTATLLAYTTPTDRDFFLTSVDIGMIKDATCDQATGTININGVSENGTTCIFAQIPVIVTTAQSEQVNSLFIPPMKLKRGSAINISGTYTAGLMSRTTVIKGYTVENITA